MAKKTATALLKQAKSWIGCRQSDGSHRKIIDAYNAHKPLARGYKVKYTDAWCATFVSACAIKTGMTDIIPTECGCGAMITLFKNKGEWNESDSRKPSAGDIIFYDWDDSGRGDNTGGPDHVGIVEKVSGNSITVIEGNMGSGSIVGRRTIAVNGRYIRGYGVPKYDKVKTASKTKVKTEKAASTLSKTAKWKGVVTADSLNVRTWAGTENDRIKSYPLLKKGTEVEVCDSVKAKDKSTWYYIRIAGKVYGFVHSGYIKKK